MKVSTTPGLLQDLCKNKTLASYLSLGNQTTSIAKDFETVMCLDPTAYLNSLGNGMDINSLSMQVSSIYYINFTLTFLKQYLGKFFWKTNFH